MTVTDLLAPRATTVDIWRTIYEHVMPDAAAIVEWVKGTGLRPYLDDLTPGERTAYLAEYGAAIDVDDPIPGAWTLEVSSAGIDRPLTRIKDWNRFAGHLARVETFFPQNGRKRFAGIVMGADETVARVRLDDGQEVAIRHPDIRRAKLVLTDALIEATASSPQTN